MNDPPHPECDACSSARAIAAQTGYVVSRAWIAGAAAAIGALVESSHPQLALCNRHRRELAEALAQRGVEGVDLGESPKPPPSSTRRPLS